LETDAVAGIGGPEGHVHFTACMKANTGQADRAAQGTLIFVDLLHGFTDRYLFRGFSNNLTHYVKLLLY
jgi:hypothetical protein